MIKLGKTYKNLMVDVNATNQKNSSSEQYVLSCRRLIVKAASRLWMHCHFQVIAPKTLLLQNSLLIMT